MNILITGTNGYIGTKFSEYVKKYNKNNNVSSADHQAVTNAPVTAHNFSGSVNNGNRNITYNVEYISLRDDNWKNADLSNTDVILHTAAIVHRPDLNGPEAEDIYRSVNVELTKELAERAVAAGVPHFIFMSTMNVYGRSSGTIFSSDKPAPEMLYGKTKLQAEKELQRIFGAAGDGFTLTIVRPPMVYGPSCPGNFARLSKLAVRIPLFPRIKNERSMIYIENLCEFLRLAAVQRLDGIFCPQNDEYVNTSDLVREIAEASGHRMLLIPGLNVPLRAAARSSAIISKIAGTLIYEKDTSIPFDYNVAGFRESIKKSTAGR